MKIQFSFEGNGKKILAGVGVLVFLIVCAVAWNNGADKRNDDRNLEQSLAQARQAQQTHDQEVRDALFAPGSRIQPPHEKAMNAILSEKARPLIAQAEEFQRDLLYGPTNSVFHKRARASFMSLRLDAKSELDRLTNDKNMSAEQKLEIGERLGHKYADIFDAWFAPKWAEVQKAGPGKASWHLEYEAIE